MKLYPLLQLLTLCLCLFGAWLGGETAVAQQETQTEIRVQPVQSPAQPESDQHASVY